MTNDMLTITLHNIIPGQAPDLCRVELDRYKNGRLAIMLTYWDADCLSWFPYAKVTTNLPDQHLNEGEFFVKDWSENELMVDALEQEGWLERTGREVVSGYEAPAVMRAAGALKEFLDRA